MSHLKNALVQSPAGSQDFLNFFRKKNDTKSFTVFDVRNGQPNQRGMPGAPGAVLEVDEEYDSLPDEQQVALHRSAFLNLRAQLHVCEPEELDVIGWLAALPVLHLVYRAEE